ncbi:GNAT family N-acetyltransferase [Falsibacillus pallidus]|uniref:Acetyltransferase (GNAT) family protein n=1 Tax=Falsibacillus pallidus TaxID=493781 RepID=A0A370GPM8_9BACI|nr:GNAT family N-acetyltransferase [Falsibacillus pallidus]RDI45685.1 acetyltransferase (GNAT) family protein [Falsibacillus pallidus]
MNIVVNLMDVLQLDDVYLQTFTRKETKSWGAFFINENSPDYYSANHAQIIEPCTDPTAVIAEVKEFYQSKHLVPRFYIYQLEQQQKLVAELKKEGFGFEELPGAVQIWDGKVRETEHRTDITIELVTKENAEVAVEIECQIDELGGESRRNTFYEEFNHPAFAHYLLRVNGTACSTACLFIEGKQARIESVATVPEFRGQGLIGELIYFLQKEARSRGIEQLWILPITPRVEKVYERYGFQTVGEIITGHAFLSGKSIKEIQGS